MKAIGVHDIIEKIRERGTKATGEIVDEKGVPIWTGLGKIGEDDARGRMPRRLPPVFAPHRGLK
jgi:hypothetical protein